MGIDFIGVLIFYRISNIRVDVLENVDPRKYACYRDFITKSVHHEMDHFVVTANVNNFSIMLEKFLKYDTLL